MLYWWDIQSPKGNIIVKGEYRTQAEMEATDRLDCDYEDIKRVVQLEPVRGYDIHQRNITGLPLERGYW